MGGRFAVSPPTKISLKDSVAGIPFHVICGLMECKKKKIAAYYSTTARENNLQK